MVYVRSFACTAEDANISTPDTCFEDICPTHVAKHFQCTKPRCYMCNGHAWLPFMSVCVGHPKDEKNRKMFDTYALTKMSTPSCRRHILYTHASVSTLVHGRAEVLTVFDINKEEVPGKCQDASTSSSTDIKYMQ